MRDLGVVTIGSHVMHTLPRSMGAVNLAHSQSIQGMQDFVTRIAAFLRRTGLAIGRAAQWIYHAPAKYALLLASAISGAVQWVKTAVILVFRTAVLCGIGLLGLLLAVAISRLACKAYLQYREQQKILALERGQAQRRTQIQEEQGRRAREQQRQHQEEIRQEEVRRQIAAEHRRRAEEARNTEARKRMQEEERERRLKDAARTQQRLEDMKLYNQWKTACDKVFEAASGRLPEPHSWPCSETWCKEDDRQLTACRHSLERLFSSTGDLQHTLQEERRRWHPNRAVFHRLQKSDERMATEITQIIHNLLR